MTDELSLILRDLPPRWKRSDPWKKGFYTDSIVVQDWKMALPGGQMIKVWIPEPKAARTNLPRRAYNCVSHALGTFDPVNHTGYWIEMEDNSVWDVVESRKLTTRTKSFGGEYMELPREGDLILIWEAQEIEDQEPAHKAIHAVVVVEAHFDNGSPRRLDERKTIVSTKNGNESVKTRQSLEEMFVEHSDFRNQPGDQDCWTVHRLDTTKTHRLNDPFAEVKEERLSWKDGDMAEDEWGIEEITEESTEESEGSV